MQTWPYAFFPRAPSAATFYDFIDYGPNRTAIVLGDGAGGRAGCLFAALVSGIMRSAAAQQPDPAQMLATMNDALQERKLESAIRNSALRPVERRKPDPASSQLRCYSAAVLSPWPVQYREGRGVSARHVPRRHL